MLRFRCLAFYVFPHHAQCLSADVAWPHSTELSWWWQMLWLAQYCWPVGSTVNCGWGCCWPGPPIWPAAGMWGSCSYGGCCGYTFCRNCAPCWEPEEGSWNMLQPGLLVNTETLLCLTGSQQPNSNTWLWWDKCLAHLHWTAAVEMDTGNPLSKATDQLAAKHQELEQEVLEKDTTDWLRCKSKPHSFTHIHAFSNHYPGYCYTWPTYWQ